MGTEAPRLEPAPSPQERSARKATRRIIFVGIGMLATGILFTVVVVVLALWLPWFLMHSESSPLHF